MLQKLIILFKELGFLGGCIYLINRCLTKISAKNQLFSYELMVQPVFAKSLLPANMSKSFECREIKQGDSNLSLMPRPQEIIEFRFNQNAICLGIFKNHELIGYIWFSFGKYFEDEVRCIYILEPANESVFDFDLYLFPEHRMSLGFMVIWEETNKYLCKRGIKQTFSRLTQSNIASKKAHDHLGWKRCARAFFLKAWRIELMFATTSPYLGFSIHESGRIKIKLNADILKKLERQT